MFECRALGTPPVGAIVFAPWSVMPGEDGMRAIAEAVVWAGANPEAPVVLAEYWDPDATPAEAGLCLVRLQMIEAELGKSLPADRLVRTRLPASDAPGLLPGAGRVDLVLKR